MPALDSERQREQARLAFRNVANGHNHDVASPVLVIHRGDDRYVTFNQTVRLVEARMP